MNYIYGQYGEDLSFELIEQLYSSLDNNKIEKVLLIVPEEAKKFIHEKIYEHKIIDRELKLSITTFKSLPKMYLKDSIYRNTPSLDREIEVSLIIESLFLSIEQLVTYKELYSSKVFKKQLVNTMRQIREYDIKSEDIKTFIDKSRTYATKAKLKDICTILKNYEQLLKDRYIDERYSIELLSELMLNSEESTHAIIFGYNDMSNIQLELSKLLITNCKTTTICINTIKLNQKNAESNGYYASNNTISRLEHFCKKNNITRGEDIEVTSHGKNEKTHMGKYLYDFKNIKYKNENSYIHINEYKNIYEEIIHTANTISDLTIQEKIPYQDIKICILNRNTYKSLFECIFKEFNLPIQNTTNKNHPELIGLIKCTLDLYSDKNDIDKLVSIFNSTILNIGNDEITPIIDNIRESSSFETILTSTNIYEESALNKLSSTILESMDILFKKLDSGNKEDIHIYLYEYLDDLGINTSIESIQSKTLKEKYIHEWNLAIAQLEKLQKNTINTTSRLDIILEVFKYNLETCYQEQYEDYINKIDIVDLNNIGYVRAKYIFMIGATEDSYFKYPEINSLLDDIDFATLSKYNIDIGTTQRESYMLHQDRILQSLTCNTNKLILSYSLQDTENNTTRPSYVIERISKIFNVEGFNEPLYPFIGRNSIEVLNNIYECTHSLINVVGYAVKNTEKTQLLSGLKEINKSKNNISTHIELITHSSDDIYKTDCNNKYNINNLYSTDTLSVSKLEHYNRCPFSYYIKYGLRIKPEDDKILDAREVGIHTHTVIEKFSKRLKEENREWEDVTNKYIEKQVLEEIQKLYKDEDSRLSNRNKYVIEKIKNLCITSIQAIKHHIAESKFTPIGYEIEFGDKCTYPPIVIQLANRKRVKLRGQIDRLDICKDGNVELVRIIDYKTGKTSLDFTSIYNGLQLQLLTYMKAAIKHIQSDTKIPVIPAGIFYVNTKDPIIKVEDFRDRDKNLSEDVLKELRMNGLYIPEHNTPKYMDNGLLNGEYQNSLNIKASIKKDGTLKKSTSQISSEELDLLIQHTEQQAIKIATNIYEGNIDIFPIKKGAISGCTYCKYIHACKFDETVTNCSYNFISEIKKDEVLSILKEEKSKN